MKILNNTLKGIIRDAKDGRRCWLTYEFIKDYFGDITFLEDLCGKVNIDLSYGVDCVYLNNVEMYSKGYFSKNPGKK